MRNILLISTLLLTACGEDKSSNVLTMTVEKQDFNVIVNAKGELKSASEMIISAPHSVRGALTLAWLAEENSMVQEGDVIARFDGEQSTIARDKAQLELEQVELSKATKEETLALDQFSISQQSSLIADELEMTTKFSSEDLSIYSKNEVIDNLLNKDYLTAKDEYLDWSKGSKTEQGTAQVQLLSLQGKGHSDTIAIHQNALNKLEVKAPQSGILIHSKNWRGEKIREGSSLWPGSKLASIPNLSQMQAKLFVLETEAAGIKAGQSVDVTLDAYPEKKISGTVNKVASIAAAKSKKSPVKYFEVIVDIAEPDPAIMKPGQKLEANIMVHSQKEAISVPNQVIYKEGEQSWVYIKRGNGFEKTEVDLGKRSQTKSLVLSGIKAGEQVALVKPDMETKS